MDKTQHHAHTLKDRTTALSSAPLSKEILGPLSEQDYRRYPSDQYKENALNSLRQRFFPGSPGISDRTTMLQRYSQLCDVVAASYYPLQAAIDFVAEHSPLAKAHLESPSPKTLWTHLKEVSEFAQEFIVTNKSSSRFPRLLTDRQAILIAHVAAPLHDLMKYLGAHQAQIMPDHEIMAAELVRRHFEGKSIFIAGVGELTFTREDCTFLSSLIGDHENIEKESGRTYFISSDRVIDRAKALFSVLDTLTGVIKRDEARNLWSCNRAQLDERFTDLVYRHIDLVKGKIFRPGWAATTIQDLSHTVMHLSQHGMHVAGTSEGETFQQALAKSGLRAIASALEDNRMRRKLPPPQQCFTAKQIKDIEAAQVDIEKLLREPNVPPRVVPGV
jgi:hypothetical protein